MKKFHGILICALIVNAWLLCSPEKAYAQGSTWAGESLQQMVEAARWKFGLLRVNAALELTNAGYDSDVYYGYQDDPVPDFTLAAGVPIQVLIPASKTVVLDIYDYPQYVFYLDTERERGWNNTFRGQLHIALEKFYIQAGGGLANVRQRLSPELDVNYRLKTNSLDGLVLWQVSRQTSLAMVYGGADYDYGDDEFGGTSYAETMNRKENIVDLVAYLQPNPRVRFFLDGQYGTYAFKEEVASERDAQSYGVFGGFEFIPREGELVPATRVQGRLSLGYMWFDMKDPQFVDGSGLAGTASLSAEILRRTTVRGFFTRGYQFSILSGASYYIGTNYGGGISRALSRRASISYDLTLGHTDYPEVEGGGGAPAGYPNRYTTHMGGLNIQLTRLLSVTFLATFARRVMDEDGLARNRNFIGLSLVYGYLPARMSTPVSGMPR